jgi:hypothetical protein
VFRERLATWGDTSFLRCAGKLTFAAAEKLTGVDSVPGRVDVDWEWNTDGGATGRVNFPAPVEAEIKAEADKAAKHDADKLAQHNALVVVAHAIQLGGALPEGYAWKLVTPYDDSTGISSYNRGEHVWLYAEKAGDDDRPCLSIYRKSVGGHGYYGRGGHDEIWIEGPGYRDAKKCKANSKGDWVAKARTFIPEYLEGKKLEAARKAATIKAGKERAERMAAFCQEAGIPSNSVRLDGQYYGEGSLSVNQVDDAGNVDLSATSVKLLREDAVAIIKLVREAAARRNAADKAASEARTAALVAKGQG